MTNSFAELGASHHVSHIALQTKGSSPLMPHGITETEQCSMHRILPQKASLADLYGIESHVHVLFKSIPDKSHAVTHTMGFFELGAVMGILIYGPIEWAHWVNVVTLYGCQSTL